jgi:hypothetical protein
MAQHPGSDCCFLLDGCPFGLIFGPEDGGNTLLRIIAELILFNKNELGENEVAYVAFIYIRQPFRYCRFNFLIILSSI